MKEIKFPEHKAGLTLMHNEHKSLYETAEQYLNSREDYFDDEAFATDTSKQRCIETNEIWELHWYPNTPVGFNNIVGATLEEVLEKANSDE